MIDTKQILNDWITEIYNPTHHITLHLPEDKKTQNLNHSKDYLKVVMIQLQKRLVKNNWHTAKYKNCPNAVFYEPSNETFCCEQSYALTIQQNIVGIDILNLYLLQRNT